MSLIPAVVASYTVANTHPADEADSSNSIGSLTFEAPIIAGTGSNGKELYLVALAQALSALQESVNAGLTKRLVERGVLAEASETRDSTVNTKLRTKVPGQPNNSKKGQTKKQQQRAQQQNLGENQMAITTALPTQDTTATTTVRESVATTMDVDPITITTTLETPVLLDSDIEHQYKPKGGIYGDDDEDENVQHKDEVDLVMEADPGEVDGACLELPKDIEGQQQGQQQHNKKRNELPSESASDAAAAKKSRASEGA